MQNSVLSKSLLFAALLSSLYGADITGKVVGVHDGDTLTILDSSKPTAQKTSSKKECGSKRTCKQMTSCAEAKFYLEECGVAALDKDKDGIPCESLCK